MYKNLRIVFTISSAICIAAAIPLGIFFDFAGWIGALIGAGIFFFLMLLCKQSQETAEAKREKSLSDAPAQATDDTGEVTASETPSTVTTAKSTKTVSPSKGGDVKPALTPYKYKRKKK